jgi:NADH:ubiquinone oxidoreductase subunit E
MMACGSSPAHSVNVPGDAIAALLARHGNNPHALVQILREAQLQHGWLPCGMLGELADGLGLTLAHVEGVATFYRFFHTSPVGEYRVLFSDNITDRMLGNASLLDDLCQRLGVQRGKMRADGRVSVDFCSCTGLCDQGPSLLINHHQVVTRLDAARVEMLAGLIEARVPVSDWPVHWSRVNDHVRRADILLGTSPHPGEAIAAALARGVPALHEEMKRSNLRGRGGAGFVTGMKWQLCRDAKGSEHYMVCNADEGEPGTFKDRVLLSRHPDMVFEGEAAVAFKAAMAQARKEDRMLERAKEATRYGEYTYVEYARFADDLVVLIDAHPRHMWLLGAVTRRLREEFAKLQVEVNEEKSRTVNLDRAESFGFLGFDFRRLRSVQRQVWRAHYTPRASGWNRVPVQYSLRPPHRSAI